jgi:hypothetical protein
MDRLVRRRPSAAMIVALLALFVALGGPAQAAHLINGKLLKKGTVTGKAIKDRSLGVRDLSKPAIRKLQNLPSGSVTETKLANGAVTPGKLAPGAVGSAAIAAGGVASGNLAGGAVGSPQVADSSLTARDIARYSGRFSLDVPPIPAGQCWSREPVLDALAGANINGDIVEVTPDSAWPRLKVDATHEYALSLTVYNSAAPDRFVLSACNPSNTVTLPAAATRVAFAYAVIDVP